jgi:hypothetical protein
VDICIDQLDANAPNWDVSTSTESGRARRKNVRYDLIKLFDLMHASDLLDSSQHSHQLLRNSGVLSFNIKTTFGKPETSV